MNPIISNINIFNKKLSAIKAEGIEKLHIVADFDQTLTYAMVNGQRSIPTWEVFDLNEEYIQERNNHVAIYQPIETDPLIPYEIKKTKMDEWWALHLNELIKAGMNKKIIESDVKKAHIVPREYLKEVCQFAYDHLVPFLILSAGLGDVIVEFLKQENLLFNNMHIIANYFEFNNEGKAIGFKNKIITSYNKSEVQVKDTPYMKEVASKTNVLLLGDNLSDIEMAQGMMHTEILKIGFLNNKKERLEDFKKVYDVVIVEDDGMKYVFDIISKLQ